MAFQSILFERLEERPPDDLGQPDFFGDLNLDQVVASLTAGRDEYELDSFFYWPVHEVDAVRYRHEVMRDLERREVREPVERFAEAMRHMREQLSVVERLYYAEQKRAWFVDAVETYCRAVESLAKELAEETLGSRGLCGLRDYVDEYVASERFRSLAVETRGLRGAFAEIRYAVQIRGDRVTVLRYEGEADYSLEVADTFARFRQGAARSYLVNVRDHVQMNHIEAQILDRVAKLYPEPFEARSQYCEQHAYYLDPTIARFDREVQVYLAMRELIERLEAAGLPFCYPHVSARSKEIAATDTFDIALASKFVPDHRRVVRNDFHLSGPERVFVVSGPNNGGKTTFARTFGQLHHLASLGLPVPGRQARLFLPDRIFSHFEREEDIETLHGKLEDELVRVHQILERATSRSVIVMNESFNSTTLHDALFVGTEVMRQILALGALGVYVTFVDEIASLGDGTVSIVSQVEPEDPARRTFKVVRQPASGLAYAWAIAAKYGLTYKRLTERIAA